MEGFVFHLQAFFLEMQISFDIILSDGVLPFQKEPACKNLAIFDPQPFNYYQNWFIFNLGLKVQ